jgi:hypothetical protein
MDSQMFKIFLRYFLQLPCVQNMEENTWIRLVGFLLFMVYFLIMR